MPRKVQLLNKSEMVVYDALDNLLVKFGRKLKLIPQTTMGEFIQSSENEDHSKINSKRVDFLICSHNFWPIVAIEFHGSGHYLNNSWQNRDLVKEKICQKAKVVYFPILNNELEVLDDVLQNRLMPILNNATKHYK